MPQEQVLDSLMAYAMLTANTFNASSGAFETFDGTNARLIGPQLRTRLAEWLGLTLAVRSGVTSPDRVDQSCAGDRVKTKETVRHLLDRLPDDCTLEDVLYHLYVLQAVDRGLADAEAGRTMPHEQVAEEMRRKWVLGVAG
jgi:hypothetical protein